MSPTLSGGPSADPRHRDGADLHRTPGLTLAGPLDDRAGTRPDDGEPDDLLDGDPDGTEHDDPVDTGADDTEPDGTEPDGTEPDDTEPDDTDPHDRYAGWADAWDDETEFRFGRRGGRRARRDDPRAAPRVVGEGVSGRVEIEVDDGEGRDPDDLGSEAPLSSYDVAARGPEPAPDWLVTSLWARDTRLGVLKTGKEADVSLLDRSVPGGEGCLLAVKTYRSAEHRMFHRDTGYLEGRRTRRSRESRAMAARSRFGRDLIAGRWAGAEFAALTNVWQAGGRVPYPVQIIGSELMMEFVGDPDGTGAPRLADHDTDTGGWVDLWHDLVDTLEVLARIGLTHGDLSPYNVLATDAGAVVIDLPQVVDVVSNPQGTAFLLRDCTRVADFFGRRGVLAADADLLAEHLWFTATGSDSPPPAPVLPLPTGSSSDG